MRQDPSGIVEKGELVAKVWQAASAPAEGAVPPGYSFDRDSGE